MKNENVIQETKWFATVSNQTKPEDFWSLILRLWKFDSNFYIQDEFYDF
jgi:hypothetical protein